MLNVQIRPLRDWNEDTHYGIVKISRVQIRPLRDWNKLVSSVPLTYRSTFKSDRCGIETCLNDWWIVYHQSSNQTVAGLKLVTTLLLLHLRLRSNQTVAGLKPHWTMPAVTRYKTFKSDRCGIETMYDIVCIRLCSMFKSDRCGIETRTMICLLWKWPLVQIRPLRDWNTGKLDIWVTQPEVQIRPLRDWNPFAWCSSGHNVTFKSDRCGIETRICVVSNNIERLFKSDRCGIETMILERWERGRGRVQIRPLRDWNIYVDTHRVIPDWVQIRPLRDWNVCRECRKQTTSVRFKSDRCGIETSIRMTGRSSFTLFKSDRCGIETEQQKRLDEEKPGSNQTVAGLKLTWLDISKRRVWQFKSDRCGIETLKYPQ